jgi:hypothetical protein
MSSISLIYNDWGWTGGGVRGNNASATPRTRTEILPNMVVESCGCL